MARICPEQNNYHTKPLLCLAKIQLFPILYDQALASASSLSLTQPVNALWPHLLSPAQQSWQQKFSHLILQICMQAQNHPNLWALTL